MPCDDKTTKKVEIVSSTHFELCATNDGVEGKELDLHHQKIYRPSLDSNLSEQRSVCSPSTSNLPMMNRPTALFPIEVAADDIKLESEDNLYEAMILKQMASLDDLETYGYNEAPSTSQSNIDSLESPDESSTLKRYHSSDISYESIKKQKIQDFILGGKFLFSFTLNRDFSPLMHTTN